MRFRIFTYDNPENRLVWEGTVADETVPLAWVNTLKDAESAGYPSGTRFRLNDWHYAETI